MSAPETIYVAGHRGMVGSAIVRQLPAAGHPASAIVTRTHAELDLTDQAAVRAFFAQVKPQQVYLAAACLLYTSPSPRDKRQSRMPSSA